MARERTSNVDVLQLKKRKTRKDFLSGLNAERDEEDCISREVAERKKEVERAEDHLLIWQKSLEKESREVALKEQGICPVLCL